MPSEQRIKYIGSEPTLLLSTELNGLAAAAGYGSDLIANTSNYPAAKIYVEIETGGTPPAADAVYEVHLLEKSEIAAADWTTDGWSAVEAAWTPVNSRPIGHVKCNATANTVFREVLDTAVRGVLGKEWGIGIKNATTQAAGDAHRVLYQYYVPELVST